MLRIVASKYFIAQVVRTVEFEGPLMSEPKLSRGGGLVTYTMP